LPLGIADMIFINQRLSIAFAAAMALFGASGSAQAAPDPGKRACAQEAKRLCPAEMRSFSRRRVEACMIAKIDQTSPICHAAMLRIKAEREAAMPRQSAIR
jgi:hypothetical protein